MIMKIDVPDIVSIQSQLERIKEKKSKNNHHLG